MQFFFFVLFTSRMIGVLCWGSEKCFVYEDYLNDVIVDKCPKSNLTGCCNGVSDVERDLAGVPPHLEVLCLKLVKDSSLRPHSFSRFQKLVELRITGSISAVLPGAFYNLLSLRRLYIDCLTPSNVSFTSESFKDFQNVRTLNLINCKLSSMEINVFKGMMKLEKLLLFSLVEDFSEVLCRLTFVSPSLNYLYVEFNRLIVLRQPNCHFLNGTSFDVKLHKIENTILFFQDVTVMDKTVLNYFPTIRSLKIEFSAFEVLKSEMMNKRLSEVIYLVRMLRSFDEICESVQALKLTSLVVKVSQVTDTFVYNLDKCVGVKEFAFQATELNQPPVNLTFINILRNLTILIINWQVSLEDNNRDKVLALCENQTELVPKLKTVELSTNNFNISSRHLNCLRYLEKLTWPHSEIQHIDDFTFNNTSLLTFLDLSFNKISQLTKYTFYGLSNLKTLDMRDNRLLVVDAETLLPLTSVQLVTLGVLQYLSSEHSKVQLNLSIPENLTSLDISSGIKPMLLILSASRTRRTPEVSLSLCVTGQSVTFQDCDNTLFKSLVQLTAETDQLLCGQSFPARFFRSLRYLMIKANRKTPQKDLTDLNRLVNLKSLILFNVDLSQQSGLNVIFHNLSKLEYLHMSFSSIRLFEKDLSRDLRSLKVLFLHASDAFSVMEDFVEPLKELRYLIMHSVLLRCSCDNAWITNWAKYQQRVEVYLPKISFERLQCKAVDGTKLLNVYAQDFCSLDVDFLVFVSTFLGLVIFMLVVMLHQLAGDYLLAFFHIAQAWVEEAMRANRKGNYRYDVFVSYCGKDETWVINELLPNLEKRGPPFLKLCLHSRDFELGKDIVDNITSSLYRSRHTLCLVSHNYLRSNWCSLEMRLATYRMLAEHRDVLILVFLEKIPRQLLNVHHRLSRLVKKQTYIDWPQDPALHKAFWDRLWAKLAPESET